MPEPTRYKTLSGGPPNGGVPPSRIFAAVAGPQNFYGPPAPDAGPPNGGRPPSGGPMSSPPPAYSPPPPTAAYPPHSISTHVSWSFGPSYSSQAPAYQLPPPPPPPTYYYPPAPPLPPPPSTYSCAPSAPHEPPGQWVNGHFLQGPGWSYLAPAEHTTVFFAIDGVRPCDYPGGYFPSEFRFTKHKVPCNLTVKELIDRVGCPKGPGTEHLGITEMVALGGYFWTAGSSWAQGSDDAKKTLAEVGWTQRRSDDYPIWLVMKGA